MQSRKRLLLVGIYLLGILSLMGMGCWIFGGYPEEYPLIIISTVIVSSILLKDRFWRIDGLQSPGRTGYTEIVMAALLLGFGLFELFASLFEYPIRGYHDPALWILSSITCLALAIKAKNRDLIAPIFMFLLIYVMMLSWGIDLFIGCPGVAGPCIYYEEFALPFLGMIVANIAGSALERSSSLFQRVHLRVTLPLFLMAVFAVLLPSKYAAAGSVVGVASTAVPLAGLLLALGVLSLPTGVKFGWAPWTGAPIDTLTPRIWILFALAISFVIFERLLQRLSRHVIMDHLSSQFAGLLLQRRVLVTIIVVSSLGIWYGIGLSPSPSLESPFRILIGIVLFLYLAKYVIDSLFAYFQVASEAVKMEDKR